MFPTFTLHHCLGLNLLMLDLLYAGPLMLPNRSARASENNKFTPSSIVVDCYRIVGVYVISVY